VMRHVREMLRLVYEAGLTVSDAARRTGVSRSTICEMLRRFDEEGLIWSLPLDQTDVAPEVRLYGPAGSKRGQRRRFEPDWAALNHELRADGSEDKLPSFRNVELELKTFCGALEGFAVSPDWTCRRCGWTSIKSYREPYIKSVLPPLARTCIMKISGLDV
jgi:DNA-binding MarR family transcriptional regulator